MVFLQSNNDMIIFGPPTLSTGYNKAPQITEDWIWCLTWLERCKNTALYVYVRSKGHIQREHPTPPWQESSCSSLKSEEVRRKSERKSVSSRGETEFSIQQDWRAGSTCHWLVGVQKGQRGRSGLDVRSIALDFGSADRTGSVSLQRTKTGQ